MNFHCIILYIYSSAVCDLSNGSANSAEFLNIRKIMGLLMCPLLRGFIWIFITYVDWLIDWLIIYITYMHLLENIPFKWRPYRRRGRAAKFRPFLNAFNLWAGGGIYLHRAKLPVTWDPSFCRFIRRTTSMYDYQGFVRSLYCSPDLYGSISIKILNITYTSCNAFADYCKLHVNVEEHKMCIGYLHNVGVWTSIDLHIKVLFHLLHDNGICAPHLICMSASWLVHGKASKYLSRSQPEVAECQQLVQKLFSCIEFVSVCECECNLVIRYNIWVVVVWFFFVY